MAHFLAFVVYVVVVTAEVSQSEELREWDGKMLLAERRKEMF